MDKITIDEIVRLHGLWIAGKDGGIRADLSGVNLSGANLSAVDLRYANLSNANLNYANLNYANLSGADLRKADLSGADLRGVNLSGANLSGANLRNANLRYTVGDGSTVRTIHTGVYTVVIYGQFVSIGCQSHDWKDWKEFEDISIRMMDGQNAVHFWRAWKPILTAIMEV